MILLVLLAPGCKDLDSLCHQIEKLSSAEVRGRRGARGPALPRRAAPAPRPAAPAGASPAAQGSGSVG